ncbi:LysR family transcriptional regulator [Roseixanthobacter liquoris]|uniref:LysR family transcriptional regulator n=1 Tax=Roseixanthobacter liquoris TaxID=3119921 RepID=UPI00372788F3
MPDLALDLRYLKYALLVAEHGSFRRAAAMLNLSQSTVSRRIQLLERRLGAPLFERNHTGAHPTPAGERFMRDAAFGAGHLHQAINDIASTRRGEIGELRIGLMASLASGFLSDLLGTYRRKFPRVEVKVEEAASQANAAGVLNGRLDAAFITGSPKIPGCEAEHLWDEGIFVALPDGHLFASRVEVAWEDIREEVFLVSADAAGPEIKDYLMRQLSGSGFSPRISVQRVGRENLLNMVAKGFGLTLTTYSTLGAIYPGVVFVPIGAPAEKVGSSVIWSATNRNPALKRLLELSVVLADQH